MQFTYYGHACFSVSNGGPVLLFDPFISPNPLAAHIDITTIQADYIFVTHGHMDHIADCVAIAKRTGATVVAAAEITDWLKKQGVDNVHPMNIGGKKSFDFGWVKAVTAVHSSALPDGSNGGNPMGFVVNMNGTSFYVAGDTGLTMDMQLIPRWAQLDFAVLPIGDNFTMGYEDAIIAAELVQCATVVGVHYDTFGYIKIDHELVKTAFKNAGLQLHLPEIDSSFALSKKGGIDG